MSKFIAVYRVNGCPGESEDRDDIKIGDSLSELCRRDSQPGMMWGGRVIVAQIIEDQDIMWQ